MSISIPDAAIRLGCVAALASLGGICSELKAHHVPGDDHSGVMLSVDPQKTARPAPQGVKAMYPTRAEAEAAASGAATFLIIGIILFVIFRVIQGFYANIRYEKQYLTWRAEPETTLSPVLMTSHSASPRCASRNSSSRRSVTL